MFADPLTELDLYWIGYIRADGHLMAPRQPTHSGRLCFSQKHFEPVEALQAYVGGTGKINKQKYYSSFNKPDSFGWNFSSIQGYKQLVELGVKSELRPDIYESKHFWRGMIDGDGCICISKEIPSIFLCVSHYDSVKFVDFLKSIGISKSTIHDYGSICKIQMGANLAAYLAKYLYLDQYSALPYKRELAQRAINLRKRGRKSSKLSDWASEYLHSD